MHQDSREQAIGIIAGAGAYLLWGIFPLYWKLVDSVSPEEVLAHRIIWSFVFMIFVLLFLKRIRKFFTELKEIFANRKKLIGIIFASLFISLNWFVFIWAVNNDHVVDASLGYYINPLVNVLLGAIFLQERFSFWQFISFTLALIGVLNLTIHYGAFPWAAIGLALSFGLYGLLKKLVGIGALTGLTIETMLVTPVALIYVVTIGITGSSSFSMSNLSLLALLFGAGIVTAIPLLLFATGANRISLSLIGFLQYIAPTIMLVLGVFLYGEAFSMYHLVSFIFIWIALTIFSLANTKWLRKMVPKLLKSKSA